MRRRPRRCGEAEHAALEVLEHDRRRIGGRDRAAGERGERRDARVADAAGDDPVVGARSLLQFRAKPCIVTPCSTRRPIAPILSQPAAGAHPDAAAALDALAVHAEARGDVDHHRLEVAHERDDLVPVGQPEDRVAGQLARAVPGDLAAPVDVDHGRAVGRAARRRRCACRPCRRPRARRGSGSPARVAGDHLRVDPALQRPALVVVEQVRREARERDVDHARHPTSSRRRDRQDDARATRRRPPARHRRRPRRPRSSRSAT